MFGLFKKKISDKELTLKLLDLILKTQVNILKKIVESLDVENQEKLCREALFYSIWLFTKNFPPTEIVRFAIGESLKTLVQKGLTEEIFHRYAKLSVERGKLYENIYESYFSKKNPMAIQIGFDSLFFGKEEFNGTNPEEIPINIMRGATDGVILHNVFLELMDFSKDLSRMRDKILNQYIIDSNKI